MPVEFKLPDVGEGVAEGELLEWRVEPGDAVEEDQVVAEVETDKAVVDIPSPVDGTVRELLIEPGDVVPVGTVIITFDADDSPGDTPDAAGDDAREGAGDARAELDEQSTGRVFAAPSVRRIARELGVDLRTVDGSGAGGRLTESDVRAAAGADAGGSDATGDDGSELKSAVTRIGEEDTDAAEADSSELTPAVTRIDDEGTGGAASAAGEGAASQQSATAGEEPTRATGGEEPTRATGADVGGPEPPDRDRTLAAPATRALARELDVDVDAVPTVEERDGEAYVTAAAVREYAEAQRDAQAADREREAATDTAGDGRETREPYRGVRRTTGETMTRSKFTAPHVTHHDRVDATRLVEARDRLRERASDADVRLTYVPFVVRAAVAALKAHPVLNTVLDEANEEIVYKHYYNVGIATATDAGLLVPVVRDADEKGLFEIAAEANDLVARARDRSIAREEMQGGTFTITNFGAIGGEYATPIINPPETAILGLGAIRERPAVHEGEVVPRDVLTVSLSIDHRVIDGAEAARFVNTFAGYLEEPLRLLE